jgi:predicted S18 family serine protease
MIDIASPVIEVATSGLDWPAIAAGIGTGVVGVAGIIGTFWQGKRGREAASQDLRNSIESSAQNLATTIEADKKRAHIAEKRRIYAQFMATLTNLIFIAHEAAIGEVGSTEEALRERRASLQRLIDIYPSMWIAFTELMLIASKEVGEAADRAYTVALTLEKLVVSDKLSDLDERIEELRGLMRTDLGEP